jgi:hypothetical protein
MESDRKGIVGPVKLGDTVLSGWQMFAYPLADQWISSLKKTAAPGSTFSTLRQLIPSLPGGIFTAKLNLPSVADTYIDMSGYKKGYVWVNGHNLGRYWSVGPQRRLYCPAPWLKAGDNEIVVLDLQQTEPAPITGAKSASGITDPLANRTIKSQETTPFEINVPANTVHTKDLPWPKDATLVAAHLDPMKDEAQAWGVGLAVGWDDQKYVQINARSDGHWSVRHNGAESLVGGCPKTGSTAAIRLTEHSVQLMAQPDGATDWILLAEFPRQEHPGAPATVRIGKIGDTWKPHDYDSKGSTNPCRVDWVRFY